MTSIKYTPPRWRQTEVLTRDGTAQGPIVVALEPSALLLRIKGRRQVLRLPFTLAYTKAAQIAAAAARLEKLNAKKARVKA